MKKDVKRGDNKKDSRGQVTIFIIIAVLVIAIVILFFIFRDKLTIKNNSSEVIVSPIYTKTLACLESTAEDGTKYIASRGGYNKIPEGVTFVYFIDEVPFYYINNTKKIPSLVRVQMELEDYIKENIDYCINLSSFREQGFNISKGNLTVSTVINENKININAIYPLSVKKGEETSVLREFDTSITSNIHTLYSASEEVLNLYSQNPGFVCITCIDDLSRGNNVDVKATSISDKNVIWFSVLDKQSELNWRFAVEK